MVDFCYFAFIISITSPCFSGCSFPTVLFVFTSIALMKLFPRSVCSLYAKLSAVVPGGIRKQSGITLPWLSDSLLTPPGNIAMYFSSSNTAVSSTCCTPVLPYFCSTFVFMNSSAAFCLSFILFGSVISKLVSPGMYFIIACFAASLSASSDSALHGTIISCGNFCFSLL